MNKRGNIVIDVFLILIIMFTLITTLVFSLYIWTNIDVKLQQVNVDDPTSMQAIHDMAKLFLFVDKLIPFIFIVLWFGAFLSSLLVNPEHPAFFLVSLILVFIYTIVAIVFVDFGQRLFSNEILLTTSNQLSNSMFFINNLHYIGFFVMIFSSVWFYSKGNTGNNLPGGFQR